MSRVEKIAIAVAVVAAIGATTWFVRASRVDPEQVLRPLGPTNHEFPPTVSGDAGEFVFNHDFRFRNDLSVPLRVSSVTASCACTSGTATPDVVGPGEELVVHTKTVLERAGGRHATVWARFDDGRGVKMHVSAELKRPVQLRTDPPHPRIADDQEVLEVTVIRTDSSDLPTPPPPTVSGDREISTTFGGWGPHPAGSQELSDAPTRTLAGTVQIRRVGDRWPIVITIASPGTDPLEFDIRDRLGDE